MNLAHNLETSARFFPNHPAVRERDRETTYGELNEKANRVASALIKIGMIHIPALRRSNVQPASGVNRR